jgi:hypothetical protein
MLLMAGCGVGKIGAEGRIARAADDYLRALAEDDTATACAQLAATAKSNFSRPCDAELHQVANHIGSAALSAAADAGVDITVDGTRGLAEIRDLDARLTLAKVGPEWRITSGHALDRTAARRRDLAIALGQRGSINAGHARGAPARTIGTHDRRSSDSRRLAFGSSERSSVLVRLPPRLRARARYPARPSNRSKKCMRLEEVYLFVVTFFDAVD